ncbi:MAG TPA: 50S ribosomal protein L29 [Acidiferrobacterales bacterium]|jgi:large subunit ribosomal protein L29
MKAKDIRTMNADTRTQELEGLRREQFNLRMQAATGQLNSPARLRQIKRDIARIKTVMNEKSGTGA